MTKQEKIKDVYGIHFDKCNPDENGWSKYQLNENQELISEFAINSVLPCEFNNFRQDNANLIYCIRPVLLKGIENNNGWTKIESINDLPNLKDKLIIFKFGNQYTTTWQSNDILETPNYYLRYSHWRVKDEILEPIF